MKVEWGGRVMRVWLWLFLVEGEEGEGEKLKVAEEGGGWVNKGREVVGVRGIVFFEEGRLEDAGGGWWMGRRFGLRVVGWICGSGLLPSFISMQHLH